MSTSVSQTTDSKLWSLLFGSLPHPACVVRNGLVYDTNEAMQRLTGFKRDDALGQRLVDTLPTAVAEKILTQLQRKQEGQVSCTVYVNSVPMLYTCRWKTVTDADPGAFLLVMEPAVSSSLPTALEKDLYDDLVEQRNLVEDLLETDELERKKFSDYLHDEVGSLLATAKHQLNLATQSLNTNTNASLTEIDKSIGLVDRSIERLRFVAMHAAPVSIEFGLPRAVQYLADTLSKQRNVGVRVILLPEDMRLPKNLETVTYRIVQELLGNAIRHADANEVILQLVQHPASVSIMAEDNGKGFDYKKEKRKKGAVGLRKIMHRVELFDGKMDVDSAPGKGTVVTVDLPFS